MREIEGKNLFTDCCGAVIHPERLLHVGAKQDLSITDGTTVQVHQEANSSALIEVPVKMVWSDLSTIYNHKEYSVRLLPNNDLCFIPFHKKHLMF